MNNIPQEIFISNLHSFYHYFNKLTDKLNFSLKKYQIIYKDLENLLKEFYIRVFDETINGKINDLLSHDIFTDNNIGNIIKDPSNQIKNTLKKKYSEKIQKNWLKIILLNRNIKWIIDNEDSNKKKIKKLVDEIEDKYKTDIINKYNQDSINDFKEDFTKYNKILDIIKQPNQNLECEE